MKSILIILIFIINVGFAQDAIYTVPGIFGECLPHYAATKNRLQLYQSPNKESQTKIIPYGVDWIIPFRYQDDLTRIISLGQLKANKSIATKQCKPELPEGNSLIEKGSVVDYLHYLGEGYGRILFNGSQCDVKTYKGFGDFETISNPEVQMWRRVLYRDGSSPGWLLQDGSQTIVSHIEC